MSTLTHLECSQCGQTFSSAQVQTFCTACRAPLLARYDLPAAHRALDRDEAARRPARMWRWAELLPVHDPIFIATLGEGGTPLLPLPRLGVELGLEQLYVKDESLNPTGSFKARGLSAAVSKAAELGVERVIIPTAGNAGGALAAYAARAGLRACVVMPGDAPRANQEECRAVGAELVLVDGLISDAAALAAQRADSEGWLDLSTFKEPYRAEGKKTMGYELAQDFNWRLPEVVIYPTGGGTGLVGMWKAFEELAALGWLESARRPRLVSVQAAGCAPVVRAFAAGAETCEFWQGAQTSAWGLRVPFPFAHRLILRDLRASGGRALAVSEAQIAAAGQRLGRSEGLFAAPEGAATLAALEILRAEGWVQPGERVVLFNTGAGVKYL